jgi:hypothetical protein
MVVCARIDLVLSQFKFKLKLILSVEDFLLLNALKHYQRSSIQPGFEKRFLEEAELRRHQRVHFSAIDNVKVRFGYLNHHGF